MVNQMVLSTEIEWIGYDDQRQMLQVEFIAGPIYQYQNVSREVYDSFLGAESHGRFFADQVKGKYEHRRIR